MRTGGQLGAFLLLALALVPLAQVQAWDQLRGDAARTGVGLTVDTPLDVLANYRFLDDGESLSTLVGPNLVETPHGLMAVARTWATGDCFLVTIADPSSGPVVRTPLDDCHAPWLQGYDAIADALLICSGGPADSPVLQSREAATGVVRWSLGPAGFGMTDPPGPGSAFWNCSGVALDVGRREAVAPFFATRAGADYSRHVIVAVDLDTGRLLWPAPREFSWLSTSNLAPLAEVSAPAGGADLLPVGATLTDQGIAISFILIYIDPDKPLCGSGRNIGAGCLTSRAVGWLTRSGEMRGMATAPFDAETPGGGGRSGPSGSMWPVGVDGLATLALGDRVVQIDPAYAGIVRQVPLVALESLVTYDIGWTAPALAPSAVIVPLSSTVSAYGRVDLALLWTWAGVPGGIVDDLVVSSSGVAMPVTSVLRERSTVTALEDRYDPPYQVDNASALFRLDPRTGAVLQRLPLRVGVFYTTEPDTQRLKPVDGLPDSPSEVPIFMRKPVVTPLRPDRVVVTDLAGNLTLLGPTPPAARPVLQLSNARPPAGVPVTLVAGPPEGRPATGLFVRWGDGVTEEAKRGDDGRFMATHSYGALEKVEALVTLTYADGTTGTSTALIDVGGAPPPDLNAVQQAFSAERQETTWGIIGILIAVAGAAGALWVRRRRHGLLEQELAHLDGIRRLARGQPVAAIHELERARLRIHESLASGRLDDGQFGVLLFRVSGLARQIHRNVVAPYRPGLAAEYAEQLDAAFEDGLLDVEEIRRLVSGLDGQRGLSDAQRRELRGVLEAWTPVGQAGS